MLSIAITVLVTFASQTWLQAIHVVKHRNNTALLRGVSVTSQTITIASQFPWIVYSLEYGLIGGVSNSVLSMVSAAIVMIICANTAWVIYGVIYHSRAYILSSSAVLACGLIMAAAKVVHRRVSISKSI